MTVSRPDILDPLRVRVERFTLDHACADVYLDDEHVCTLTRQPDATWQGIIGTWVLTVADIAPKHLHSAVCNALTALFF